eukprot:TRINITY_DN20318_c0_g1_i1.p1 TRINITY_DN20318_c0_g1~~TRINITY_DN20318_c0_g1_i1.p1  ORF type:complete len:233 (+),score=36.68 TRINITY_DN20318_c0_g1_i1:31-729(+)
MAASYARLSAAGEGGPVDLISDVALSLTGSYGRLRSVGEGGHVDLTSGIALSLTGNVVINVGTNLWRFGGRARIPGILLFGIGNVLSFMSFALAPQSLLSAMSSVQFVTNVALSYLLFGEPPTRRAIAGTLIIVAADLVIVASCPEQSEEVSAEQLMRMLEEFWCLYEVNVQNVFHVCIFLEVICFCLLFCLLYRRSPLPVGLPASCCRKLDREADIELMNKGLQRLELSLW